MIGVVPEESTLRIALPNYVLPRWASVPVFSSVTVYTVDRGTGRITATATLTAARQLVALLAAES